MCSFHGVAQGGLDDDSAHSLFAALVPRCPHPQAAAWLLDLARRRTMDDLARLATAASTNKPEAGPLCFVGNDGLKPLTTQLLAKAAAETRAAVLSSQVCVLTRGLTRSFLKTTKLL